MGANQHGEEEDEGGVVIPLFPNAAKTPPPLPRLTAAYPTPGGGHGMGHGVMFGATVTRRFSQEAA